MDLLVLLFLFLYKSAGQSFAPGRAPTSSPSPSAAPTVLPPLPDYEVDAIKKLLKSSTKPWDASEKEFSVSVWNTTLGVQCRCGYEKESCRIIGIDFSNHELNGRIPEEIGNLSSLEKLVLSGNRFSGNIPETISKLLNLKRLYLNDNLLRGSIPPSLGNLTELQHIYLKDNLFSGKIPEELCNLEHLQFLYLGQNNLSENIPLQIGRSLALKRLYLNDNHLSGKLPHQLGNLLNLRSLGLDNNNLTGKLPASFRQLRKLEYVNLRGNKFTGKVSEDIGNWKFLQQLWLSGNNFEGPLPIAVSSLTSLRYLFVTDLIGTSGDKRGFEFPNLSQMNLRYLTLHNCSITGKIPDYIFLMPSLHYLDLSFNNLTDAIPDPSLPPTRSTPYSLKYIFLRRNNLSGELPEWMINRPYSYVDVSENNITRIKQEPAIISKNLNLFEYTETTPNMTEKWQENPYTCQKKTKYSQLFINCGGKGALIDRNYYEADLERNGGATFILSKNERWGYSSMGTFIYAYQDLFLANRTCNVSMANSHLYTSARLAPLSLKYYGFCLKNGKYKVELHFAEIVLDPDEGLRSKARRVFDIEIQGEKVETSFNIAEEARGVNQDIIKKYITHVTNSRLEIHLFWTGIGSIYQPTVYYGPLISAISASRHEEAQNSPSPLEISGIVGASLLLPLLVLLILWRRGYFGALDPELEALQGTFISLQKIKVATNNFSDDNYLGKGGFGLVFKGKFSDGTAIAVKQCSVKSMQETRVFVNEIVTISSLQHPNLVKLLGWCTQGSQRLLVYEYMENNSLHNALHSEELKKRLSWATRVKICKDIANGLVYLHDEAKVVHRDIKPNNILLDSDFTAKISDFGFAKLYEGEENNVTKRLDGTIGYMAPEYAMMGIVTFEADVFSFGVVMLEIVSGKDCVKRVTNDQSEYLLDMARVLHTKGNLMELVDETLESGIWDHANTILNLAILCTNPAHKLRPSMSKVVKILEGEMNIRDYTPDHNPTDDAATAQEEAGVSQPTHSGSTSYEGNSAL